MKIKAVSGMMLTLLLVGMLTLAFDIQTAKASGTIYIRADGNIDPPTAPIQLVGDSYTIIGNITSTADGIVVERSNIIIDGNRYTLQGAGDPFKGIYLSSISNVTIKNANINGFYWGVLLYSTSQTVLSGNNITNNWVGIWLNNSSDNSVRGNNITNNDDGIRINVDSSNNIVSRNNITNNAGAGIDIRDGSFNITVSGNNITNNGVWGVHLDYYYTSGNFYHNNFINNTLQVHVGSPTAVWDNGYPNGGNYWSDYTGVDANGDGIGDTPYIISTSYVEDRYPLMNPWTPSWAPVTPPPEAHVGVKAGDWIKCTYTISGWPAGTPYPEWLKVEFLSVEGTTATVRVTMRMSNGTELSGTVPVDVVSGGQAFGLSGFLIPANCTTGDCIYMSGYGNVTIEGETTRTYVGASRTVVYASFSQLGSQLTCYWDKQTGVMVEASTTSGSITATGKATETNMWEAVSSPLWMQWWFYAIVAAIIVALAGTVYFLKKRKPPTPTAPTPPTEGT